MAKKKSTPQNNAPVAATPTAPAHQPSPWKLTGIGGQPGITALPQFGSPGFNGPDEDKQKPKPNLIMPVAPMFAKIMEPKAAMMVKKLARVKRFPGQTEDWIDVVKETEWNKGAGNENLEQRSLNVGTIGMVVGLAEPKTVLRFMVTNGSNLDDGIYHVSVMNLEPLADEDQPPATEAEDSES